MVGGGVLLTRVSLYAVFLHVKGLSLTDSENNVRIGSAYAWRRGAATAAQCDITAEKVVPLAPNEELRQKSVVFYIDTDEQDA